LSYSAKSQKEYNDKCHIVRIKYTPKESGEYERLNKYLEKENITITAYLKELIKADLDSKGV
jgi:hypothetical protein